jgi:hypothetical protein
MTRRCTCRHCTAPAAVEAPATPEPIDLPALPTPIRVHTPGLPPFDCTLHPDGTLTAVLGGEERRNSLSFAEMRERNWATAHVEFDPAPLADEPEREPSAEAAQVPLALIPTP